MFSSGLFFNNSANFSRDYEALRLFSTVDTLDFLFESLFLSYCYEN